MGSTKKVRKGPSPKAPEHKARTRGLRFSDVEWQALRLLASEAECSVAELIKRRVLGRDTTSEGTN